MKTDLCMILSPTPLKENREMVEQSEENDTSISDLSDEDVLKQPMKGYTKGSPNNKI